MLELHALSMKVFLFVFFLTLQMTFYSNSMLTFICLTTAGAFIANVFGSYQFLFYSLSLSLFLM